jgi:hypothetical protein
MTYTNEELERMKRNLGVDEYLKKLKEAEEKSRKHHYYVRKYPEVDGMVAEKIVKRHIYNDFFKDKKIAIFENKIGLEGDPGEILDDKEWDEFRNHFVEASEIVGNVKYPVNEDEGCFIMNYGIYKRTT